MIRKHLERLFDHMRWADARVLELLRASADVRAQADVVRLLSHLLASERVWLLRLRGEDSARQPIWPDLEPAELHAMAAANRAGYDHYLAALTEDDLDRDVEYTNTKGATFRTRALDVLTHVAMHGSYHRGQIARAVRAAGIEPVNTDYITYVREQGAAGEEAGG